MNAYKSSAQGRQRIRNSRLTWPGLLRKTRQNTKETQKEIKKVIIVKTMQGLER